jgi:hypothetical protein
MPPRGKLLSVVLTFSDKGNRIKQRIIPADVAGFGGLVWKNKANAMGSGPSNKSHKLLPTRFESVDVRGHHPGTVSQNGEGECCYWDGNEWVCPDDLME